MLRRLKNTLLAPWRKATSQAEPYEPAHYNSLGSVKDTALTTALMDIRKEKTQSRLGGRPVNKKQIAKLRKTALNFIKKGKDLNHQNNQEQDALYLCLDAVEPEILQALLDKGANLNQTNSAGQTALDVATHRAASNLKAKDTYAEMCEMLVEAGAEHGAIEAYKMQGQEENPQHQTAKPKSPEPAAA